ncbi:TPA: hypothetical protein ROY02_003808 [Bacillus cereus]|uniref:hypothetical protein n=1 Tax=Bacillus cereus group TaxID=86661 RepID=UPI0008937E30|nr:hypothetical protein [Bacillus thuringiensis]HDR4914391.1 hypothetical protein [Bacillus cereus]OFC75045.1 hypothetical protein BTGOE1_46910 [Bacillus thuringiensis]OFC77679.1 hypothetical protein BTGOE2_47290 [Bacillus thuringiensis]HDR4919730.1 hypothetical protein [Bacillus cereus]HDX9617032.1 hypothetical protein [Bacillus thuringiensis]
MKHKTQLQMLKLSLEDKIRGCNNAMIARKNKNLKHDIRIYSEILVMLRDYKQMVEK